MASTRPICRFEEDTIEPDGAAASARSVGAPLSGPLSSRKSRRYDSKFVLFSEGDAADTVYEVVTGTVMLYTISENGRRTVIGFMQRGDYFGFVMRDAHSYFAQTVGKCVVRTIPRVKLWSEIREHHRAAEKFLALESNALENARKHITLLTRKTPIERVSMFLLDMSYRQGAEGCCTTEIHLPMTRADIADYLGLVVETVCRGLTHLKEGGAIGMGTRGQIGILDAVQLRRYAAGEEEGFVPEVITLHDYPDRIRTSLDMTDGLCETLREDLVAY